MVLRRDGGGVLAVGQGAHAWLCGQLARAWGNPRFGAVVPLAEVALGAEQHDVGMAQSDLKPARHPSTGLPQSFIEMPVADNVALWRAGPPRLITQSRYAALLAVMHGRRLYERRDQPDDAVCGLLAASRELERTLLEGLRADPETAPHATEEVIARNSQLVWTWDSLSLALLLDWAPFSLCAVPAAGDEATDMRLARDGTLDPWPFSADTVELHCEGRRLAGSGYESDAALAHALAHAPWETVRFVLHPVAPPAPTI